MISSGIFLLTQKAVSSLHRALPFVSSFAYSRAPAHKSRSSLSSVCMRRKPASRNTCSYTDRSSHSPALITNRFCMTSLYHCQSENRKCRMILLHSSLASIIIFQYLKRPDNFSLIYITGLFFSVFKSIWVFFIQFLYFPDILFADFIIFIYL